MSEVHGVIHKVLSDSNVFYIHTEAMGRSKKLRMAAKSLGLSKYQTVDSTFRSFSSSNVDFTICTEYARLYFDRKIYAIARSENEINSFKEKEGFDFEIIKLNEKSLECIEDHDVFFVLEENSLGTKDLNLLSTIKTLNLETHFVNKG